MGDFDFYGYWASWDLHSVFQRQIGWGHWGPRRNVEAHGNELEGLGSQAPFQPSSGDAGLGSSPTFWKGGNLEPQGSKDVVHERRPLQVVACTGGSTNIPTLLLPFYLTY